MERRALRLSFFAPFTAVTPGVTYADMVHPLTEARKRAKLSQQALAELIGKDRLTILRIEKSQTKPPLETVARIITVLKQNNVELSADAFLPPDSGEAS